MVSSRVRGGKRIREKLKEIKELTSTKHKCPSCGKKAVKRISTGLWRCNACKFTFAGGAYTPTTPVGEVVNRIISDIAKQKTTR